MKVYKTRGSGRQITSIDTRSGRYPDEHSVIVCYVHIHKHLIVSTYVYIYTFVYIFTYKYVYVYTVKLHA